MLGKLLDGSGFAEIIEKAGVLTSGRAESVVAGTDSHLKRVRYTHQVFLAACMMLCDEAYEKHLEDVNPSERGTWEVQMKEKSLMFAFWFMINGLQLVYLRFLRSIREGDIELYIQSLDEVTDWCHALDHTHYARWLPVHLKDLVELATKLPLVYQQFKAGKFVVQRSNRRFSLMGKDHSHEQSVKLIKSNTGVGNIFDSKDAMDTHIMALPEKMKAISQFEEFTDVLGTKDYDSTAHLEESLTFQKRFGKDVKAVYTLLQNKGNPFLPESGPRLKSYGHHGDVMDCDQAKQLCDAHNLGKMRHGTYTEERLVRCEKPITDIIQKARLPMFSNHLELKNKKQNKVKAITHDYKLTVQMLLSLIGRPEQEMTDFFKHESRKYPPTLADDQGRMRTGNKSEVVSCLKRALDDNRQFLRIDQSCIPNNGNNIQQSQHLPSQAVETEHPDFIQNENSNGESGNDDTVDDDENGNIDLTDNDEHLGIDQLDCVTVKLFDGPALAQMIIPKTGKDFNYYADKQFIPYVLNRCKNNVLRSDTLFDVYDTDDNLKQQTHDRRGETVGTETSVEGETLVPSGLRKWKLFLNVKANKTALFKFLSKKLTSVQSSHLTIYATDEDQVLVNSEPLEGKLNGPLHTLGPCSQPEADTRIFLHIKDAVNNGHRNVSVRSVDSDIVVLAVGLFNDLAPLEKLFVEYGTSKNFQVLPAHEIAACLGPKARALPIFHALSGCDCNSSPSHCGKLTAWNAWDLVPGLTDMLLAIQEDCTTFTRDSVHMQRLERYYILQYCKSSSCSRVNQARVALFKTGTRLLDKIPPTQDALLQHIKRALLQAGYIWKQALKCKPILPPFTEWGWKRDTSGLLTPLWSLLSDISHTGSLLLHCNCRVSCTGNCKCARAGLNCTSLCRCDGACAATEIQV